MFRTRVTKVVRPFRWLLQRLVTRFAIWRHGRTEILRLQDTIDRERSLFAAESDRLKGRIAELEEHVKYVLAHRGVEMAEAEHLTAREIRKAEAYKSSQAPPQRPMM